MTATQRRVVRLTTGWLLASAAALALAGFLRFDLWAVLSVLGFLVIVQWTAPLSTLPAWRRRLRIPILLAFVVFFVAVASRLLERFAVFQ